MPSSFSSFAEVEAWLAGLGLFHMDLTLGRMERFLRASRLFAMTYGPPFAVIHVVGTNGKGSTSAFLDSLAGFHDYSSGLYLSPHFVSPRERIRVDGEALDEEAWTEAASEVMAATGDDPTSRLTYFEFLTALALVLFTREGVDVAVLEAGLGGTHDATNALAADLTVFTPIGLDHQDRLGRTIEEIARDKAGAVKPGGLVVSAPQEPAVEAVLRERARQAKAEFFLASDVLVHDESSDRYLPGPLCPLGPRGAATQAVADQGASDAPDSPSAQAEPFELSGVHPAMRGAFQQANLHLALAAWTVFLARRSARPDLQACRDAAQEAYLPGRFQFVPAEAGWPALVLDSAHNVHGLRALAGALAAESVRPAAVVFSCLKDKSLEEMAPLVLSLTDGPVLVPELSANERARPAAEVVAAMGECGRAVESVETALAGLADASGPVLVCGSMYLLAEVFSLRPHLLEPPE